MANRTERVANVPTWASFCAVLDDIDERHGDLDLLVVTGDLAQDELEATYRHLREGLGERLSRSRVIPGNHDDRPALRKVFPEFFSAGIGCFFVKSGCPILGRRRLCIIP